jgi:hypothetical protein
MATYFQYVKCSLPNCNNGVGYHIKRGTGYTAWKTMCNVHRSTGKTGQKHIVDKWKMVNGCANKNSHYGFPCTSTPTIPAHLEVNHIDGVNLHRDPSNVEILCTACHRLVSKNSKHHLQNHYSGITPVDTGLFTGLF